jgi:hypothetical protein
MNVVPRKLYNTEFTMRLQSIGKSFLLAVAGAGIVSFFAMMAVIPIMALMQRLSGNIAQHSEVVNPAVFMRTYGIALAAVAFVIVFFATLMRSRRQEQSLSVRH